MRFLKTHSSFFVAAVFFVAALVLVYPFYQYYIDPDATAYLTLAARYARGDFHTAINGYWSPWSIWLTALLIKSGIASFKAAIIINAVGALGFLMMSHILFSFFKLGNAVKWWLETALAVFLIYAVFWQSFADLWGFFFLLVVLRIMLAESFHSKPALWLTAGFVGALAYLAKAYALPFFILEIIVCGYFMTGPTHRQNRKLWFKMIFICLCSLLVFSFPWIYMLHEKYGIWMTGTAGKLNTSWYLVGHPYWKEGIIHLLPPVYEDSPSYWEDAWMVNGYLPQFWDSPKLFALQVVRLCYNVLKFVESIHELSCFFAIAFVLAFWALFSKYGRQRCDRKFLIVVVSFLLFPVGYFLINFQARYLWYMLPLSLIVLVVILQRLATAYQVSKRRQNLIVAVFAFSVVAFPILGLKDLYKAGRKEHQIAQVLKDNKIRGSFTTNIPYGKQTQDIMRLAYFSGNAYYSLPLPAPDNELLQEMRRYRVAYYFSFGACGACQLIDNAEGVVFQKLEGLSVEGLTVYELSYP